MGPASDKRFELGDQDAGENQAATAIRNVLCLEAGAQEPREVHKTSKQVSCCDTWQVPQTSPTLGCKDRSQQSSPD